MDEIAQKMRLHQELALYFSEKTDRRVTETEILYALIMRLGDRYDIKHPVHVWDLPLDFDHGVAALSDFNFFLFDSAVVTDGGEFEDAPLFETKATIKVQGQIWIIHRYDADPFPSNPHAHNAEQNIKLNLRNGECFRNRRLITTISKKALLAIRELAAVRYKGALPDLAV